MMDQLAQETAVFGIHLTPHQLGQFAQYQALLLEWNQRLNLTAIREPQQIQRRHFLDALTCATVMEGGDGRTPNESSLIDVGTGAGFPGLPLKILYPGLQLTLVESIVKKARFLENVVSELGLAGVIILTERAEVVGQDSDHRGQYDWAVARAVAEMRILVEYLLPLCQIGGSALAQKGSNASKEAELAKNAIKVLGGAPPQLFPIQLPEREETHYLARIKKETETPSQYPRRVGIPAKRPL